MENLNIFNTDESSSCTAPLFCVLFIVIRDNRRPIKNPYLLSLYDTSVFCFNSCRRSLFQWCYEGLFFGVWSWETADIPDSCHPVRRMTKLWQKTNYRDLLWISPLSLPPSSHTLLTEMARRTCQWWSMESWELVGSRALVSSTSPWYNQTCHWRDFSS